MYLNSAELTYLIAMERQQELVAVAERRVRRTRHHLLARLRNALAR